MWNPKRIEGWVKVGEIKLGDTVRYVVNSTGAYSQWMTVMRIDDLGGGSVTFHLGLKANRPQVTLEKKSQIRVNRFITDWNSVRK